MIQITPQMRVLVAIEAADFRRGIDGLARLCREALGADPFTGTVFVYRNRRGTAVNTGRERSVDGDGEAKARTLFLYASLVQEERRKLFHADGFYVCERVANGTRR